MITIIKLKKVFWGNIDKRAVDSIINQCAQGKKLFEFNNKVSDGRTWAMIFVDESIISADTLTNLIKQGKIDIEIEDKNNENILDHIEKADYLKFVIKDEYIDSLIQNNKLQKATKNIVPNGFNRNASNMEITLI